MHSLGSMYSDSSTGMSGPPEVTISVTTWHIMDERASKVLHLVATDGPGHRERGVHVSESQQNRKARPNAPLHLWEWLEQPWSHIHIDYTKPFLGRMFLVIIDAHSKWLEVYPTNATTTQATIERMRQCFAAQGLPQILVSDNGSCFISSEFNQFMTQNGIQHITSTSFYPSSNGLVERTVQTFKEGMKKIKGGSIETCISRFLFGYCITPQAITELSPAEMLMSRRLRSAFDLLKLDIK